MTKSRMKGVGMLFGIELGEVFHVRNAKCAINDDFKFTEEGLMRSSWTSNVWKTAKAVDLKYLLSSYKLYASLVGGLVILILGSIDIEIAIAIQCIANLIMGLADLKARKLLLLKSDEKEV